MQCPICAGVKLVMTERSGIEIDYCPQCRGVWLDRGELDKIIERSVGTTASEPVQPAPRSAPPQYPSQHAPHGQGGYYPDQYYKKKKRESFLGELFDF
jgi:uncharacterized protein